MLYLGDLPMKRWGRVIRPADDAGSYVMIELETRDPRFPPPPLGALRLWHRRPGTAEDSDLNWTVWFGPEHVGEWIGTSGSYEVEWLPEGSEPDWGR